MKDLSKFVRICTGTLQGPVRASSWRPTDLQHGDPFSRMPPGVSKNSTTEDDEAAQLIAMRLQFSRVSNGVAVAASPYICMHMHGQ